MQQIFFIIGIIGIVLFVLCAAAAAVVFFKMDIRGVYADLTGKRRQVELNEFTKTSSNAQQRARNRRVQRSQQHVAAPVITPETKTDEMVRQAELIPDPEPGIFHTTSADLDEEDMETSVIGEQATAAIVDEEDAATSILKEQVTVEVDEEDATTSLLEDAASKPVSVPASELEPASEPVSIPELEPEPVLELKDEEDATTSLLEEPVMQLAEAAPAPAVEAAPAQTAPTGFVILRAEMGFSANAVIDSKGQEVPLARQ